MSSGPLLTVPEVADLLQVKASTVYAWVKQRKLPAVILSIGRKGKETVRFRRSSIEAWIADHEREAQGFTRWDRR